MISMDFSCIFPSDHSKFMKQNTSAHIEAIRLRKAPSAAQEKLHIAEKPMLPF
jgi:hypothetical protein